MMLNLVESWNSAFKEETEVKFKEAWILKVDLLWKDEQLHVAWRAAPINHQTRKS